MRTVRTKMIQENNRIPGNRTIPENMMMIQWTSWPQITQNSVNFLQANFSNQSTNNLCLSTMMFPPSISKRNPSIMENLQKLWAIMFCKFVHRRRKSTAKGFKCLNLIWRYLIFQVYRMFRISNQPYHP